jgi:hypothetical protein
MAPCSTKMGKEMLPCECVGGEGGGDEDSGRAHMRHACVCVLPALAVKACPRVHSDRGALPGSSASP